MALEEEQQRAPSRGSVFLAASSGACTITMIRLREAVPGAEEVLVVLRVDAGRNHAAVLGVGPLALQ